MRKKNLDRDIVILLLFTLFTIVSWVGFEVYRAFVRHTPPPANVQTYLKSFDTNLNTEVLNKLQSRNP